MVEVTKGAALIIDYGEDQAFSNSFRGIQNHKLVKDWPTIFDEVGRLDLTSYVNFKQISEVAQINCKKVLSHGPIPQGQFLESMGIRVRMQALQQRTQDREARELLEASYVRLCSPDEMGAIYKFLYLGHKDNRDIFPFLGEQTEQQSALFG